MTVCYLRADDGIQSFPKLLGVVRQWQRQMSRCLGDAILAIRALLVAVQ